VSLRPLVPENGGVAAAQPRRLGGHEDRPVFLTADGLVAKCYPTVEAAASASATMAALWLSDFGAVRVPPGLPRPRPAEPGATTVHMELLDGQTLSDRRGQAATRLPLVVDLLVDLHGCGLREGRPRSARGVVRSLQRKAADLRATVIGPAFLDVVRRATARTPVDEQLVATHGDFSPGNVMVTSRGLRLIDFDRFRLASPARDVAYWGAWHWATALLRTAEPSWRAGDELLRGYCDRRPAGAASLEAALGFHRAAALLRIAHGWSALQADPEAAARVVAEAADQLA
jgi:aminoglycoside phosphotransferase (APT) family kinase protein